MAVKSPAGDPAITGLDVRSITTELAAWQVERDALLLSDGSYVIGFACDPLTTDGMSEDELTLLARRAQAWLHVLPEGEDVRVVYDVAPHPGGAITNHAEQTEPVQGFLRLIRDARLQSRTRETRLGATLGARLWVFLSYHPPRLHPPNRWAIATITAGMVGILASALIGWRWGLGIGAVVGAGLAFILPRRPGKFGPRHRQEVERDHRVLRGLRATTVAHLSAIGLNPRPLTPDGYLEATWRYLNPRQAHTGAAAPPLVDRLYELDGKDAQEAPWALPQSFRQLAARSAVDPHWSHLRTDDRYVKVLAMDTLPVGTTVMLHLLPFLAMRDPVTVVLDIHKPRTHAIVQRLIARSSIAGNVRQSTVSEAATVGAARQHQGLQQILWRVYGGETQVMRVGLACVLSRRTLDALDQTVLEIFRLAGEMHAMTLVDETLGLRPQFHRLAPLSGVPNRRMRLAMAENVVHLFPLSGPWRGSPRAEAIFPNRWGGLTALDLFDRRVAGWNGVVSGKTGTGKSAFMCQLLLQVLRPHIAAIIIDKGANTPPGSYLTLCRALDGTELRFDLGGATSINPFDVEPGQLEYFVADAPQISERDREHAAAKHTFLVTLVDKLSGGLTLDEHGLISDAIVQTYKRYGRDGPVFLHDLVKVLRNPGTIAGHAPTPEQQHSLDRIATRLYQWVERGRYAQLLDCPTNVSLGAQVTYIDLGPITTQPDLMPVVVLLLTDLIYRQAMRRVGEERTIVVQDELWSILADPTAAKFLDDMYRRFRHVGASIISVSQDIRDFQNQEARAILGNATWWFLLPVVDTAATAEIAQLNPRQERLLRRLGNRPGEQAEILAIARFGDRAEAGVLVSRPTSLEFWLSASNPDERALRARYVEQEGTVIAGIKRLAREHPRGSDLRTEEVPL